MDRKHFPVKVIFRYAFDRRSMIALLPQEVGGGGADTCVAYDGFCRRIEVNIGVVMQDSRPATPSEYAALKRGIENALGKAVTIAYAENKADRVMRSGAISPRNAE